MSINLFFFQWLSGEANFQVFRKKVVNTKGVITHYGVGLVYTFEIITFYLNYNNFSVVFTLLGNYTNMNIKRKHIMLLLTLNDL